MNITKRQLKRIVRKVILESSRAGEAHDAGYEDGSHGLDPRDPDDMDYMSGYEMGEEDATPTGYGPEEDYSAPPGEEDYYAPDGKGEQATDAQLKSGWDSWLEERGLEFEDLDDLAQFAGAPNRTWLDTRPPANGKIGPADIEEWAEDQRAAREILSTRMGSYKGTTLPGGRKI